MARAPVAWTAASSAPSVSTESYGGSICPVRANQLAFSKCRSATSKAERAGQNNAPLRKAQKS